MNRTKIEWCDYTLNPVKGLCPMHCKTPNGYEYCYAAGERGLYKRFKWNPEIRYDSKAFNGLVTLKKPSRIFVGSTFELFGEWVRHEWLEDVFMLVRAYPQHTFIFLTKLPEELLRWSPFPSNCHIGVSVTNQEQYDKAILYLKDIQASVKFLSFEPLLNHIILDNKPSLVEAGITWIICGQCTPVRKWTMPKVEWIKEIVEACDGTGMPVFQKKDNLQPLLTGQWAGWKLRQEFPRV